MTFFFLSAVQNCCVLHSSPQNLFGWEEHMLSSGRVVFGEMDEVVFGKPASEAVARQAQRLGATRVFLMVRRRKAEFAVKSLHGADLPWARNRLAVRYVRRRDQTRRLRAWPALAGRGSPGLGR